MTYFVKCVVKKASAQKENLFGDKKFRSETSTRPLLKTGRGLKMILTVFNNPPLPILSSSGALLKGLLPLI